MSAIKLTADSGGGTVELKAPATTTSNAAVVFKLPVADGTSGQALTTNASGQLAFATVAGGKILQVKQTVKTDTSSQDPLYAGNAWTTDSFFSLAITPSATTSKIHVTGKINVGVHEGNGVLLILRVNGAVLNAATGDTASSRKRTTSLGFLKGYNIATASYDIQAGAIDIPFDFLHSPSSTSQQTYSFELRTTHPGTSAVFINRTSNDGDVYYVPRSISTITAMEVGA